MQLSLSDHAADPDTRVIQLSGEIDLYSAPAFKERMDQAVASGKSRVVVDLSQVTFFDTTGLWVLVNGHKRLVAEGGSLEVICTNEHILKTFEITGVSQLFPVRERRNDSAATPAGEKQRPSALQARRGYRANEERKVQVAPNEAHRRHLAEHEGS